MSPDINTARYAQIENLVDKANSLLAAPLTVNGPGARIWKAISQAQKLLGVPFTDEEMDAAGVRMMTKYGPPQATALEDQLDLLLRAVKVREICGEQQYLEARRAFLNFCQSQAKPSDKLLSAWDQLNVAAGAIPVTQAAHLSEAAARLETARAAFEAAIFDASLGRKPT